MYRWSHSPTRHCPHNTLLQNMWQLLIYQQGHNMGYHFLYKTHLNYTEMQIVYKN